MMWRTPPQWIQYLQTNLLSEVTSHSAISYSIKRSRSLLSKFPRTSFTSFVVISGAISLERRSFPPCPSLSLWAFCQTSTRLHARWIESWCWKQCWKGLGTNFNFNNMLNCTSIFNCQKLRHRIWLRGRPSLQDNTSTQLVMGPPLFLPFQRIWTSLSLRNVWWILPQAIHSLLWWRKQRCMLLYLIISLWRGRQDLCTNVLDYNRLRKLVDVMQENINHERRSTVGFWRKQTKYSNGSLYGFRIRRD